MNSFNPKTGKSTPEEIETIEALLKYPSLEKVFDERAPDSYEKTKRTMTSVIAELERVIRRGTKQDAERAETILEAYRTALNFLDELENIRRKQAKRQ
jgi:hypothetical protein